MGALLVFQHETMSGYRGTRAMRDEMDRHSRFRDVSEKSEELVDGQTKSAASLGVANAEFGGHAQRLIVGR
jgi:hypothetical protein